MRISSFSVFLAIFPLCLVPDVLCAPPPFPFGLKKADLPKIEISYLFQSRKLNAGDQEIIVSGKKTIQLKKALNADEKPESVRGEIGEKEIVSLLALMEESDFFNLQNSDPAEGPTH